MVYTNSTIQAILNLLNNIHCVRIIIINENTYFVTFSHELIMVIHREKNSFVELLKSLKFSDKQLNFIYDTIKLFMDKYSNCYLCKWQYDKFYNKYIPVCYTELEAREAGLIV